MTSFAHLLGRRKGTSAAKADDVSDGEEKKLKKGKRADDDGGDLDDPDDNEDDKRDKLDEIADDMTGEDGLADDDDDADEDQDAKKAKKSKRAKAEKDDDDDEDKRDDGAKKARSARLAERARCEAIFASPHAAGRPNVAARLAFKTDMSAKDAIGVMAAMDDETEARKPQSASGLRGRMTAQQNPDVGSEPRGASKDISTPEGFAAAVVRADKWRRNEA